MPKLVVHGAKTKCSQGTSPGSLSVVGAHSTDDDNGAATVEDHIAIVNISAFGMCKTQANPQVASATSAAQGVLTPQPCTPIVSAAWSPGSSVVTINDKKALSSDSTCSCQWTGKIEITDPASPVDVD